MFLTCIFKIHNPSKYKQAVMDHALYEYTRGYQELLAWAQENEEYLKEKGTYNENLSGMAVSGALPRLSLSLHSTIVTGLNKDVAGSLMSYWALKEIDNKTSFPTSRSPLSSANEDALDNFMFVGSDEEDYNLSRDYLATVSRGQYMPLYFAGADGSTKNRYFSLLINTEKPQLLGLLYLLPNKHELGRKLDTQGNLIRLDTGEVFQSKSNCAILVPLEVGRNGWQEYKFLQPSMNEDVQVKSAYLVKKNDEYFLHVAFNFPCPEPHEPETYLGVDQGILVTAAYAVIDTAGTVIEVGHEQDNLRQFQLENGKTRRMLANKGRQVTKRHYKQQEIDSRLHKLANNLIDRALEHRSGIVVEDLNPEFMVRGKAVFSRFQKFDHILEYKCKLAGIPFRRVFAAYSSKICPVCGEDMERSDDRQAVWCLRCGYEGHADDTAAINIARRVFYKKAEWNGYREFHRSFTLDNFAT